MNIELENKGLGRNGFIELWNQLDEFVENNFDTLYEGAVRLTPQDIPCCAIASDYYAPRRVQIGNTRLHRGQNLKYADGHKYSEDFAPTEAQLRQTVEDLQKLLDAAAENILAPFTINIIENEK